MVSLAAAETGTVHFVPADDQKEVPQLYRLGPRSFDYTMKWMYNLPGYDIGVYDVRFPSAVESPTPENNTVYAEYYRPEGKGPFPCQSCWTSPAATRRFRASSAPTCRGTASPACSCRWPTTARAGRPAAIRLLSPDFFQTTAAVRQTVLDLRLATAWMAARPEIDAKRLGIVGTSLGSFMAALTAETEPRLGRVALLLGGGGLADGYYDDPRAADYRRVYELLGGSKEKFAKLIAPYDPITCARISRAASCSCWRRNTTRSCRRRWAKIFGASGGQEIVWYNSGHYTSVVYVADGLERVVKHFLAD